MSDPKKTCTAVQVNRRVSDFHCRLDATAHVIHVDPATGTRWSTGGPPRGMRRQYAKRYANPKLARRARRGVR